MSSINAHELRNIGSGASLARPGEAEAAPREITSPAEIELRSLPPTDHGKQAYLVLAGCTLIQAPVWGEQLI